MTTPPGPQPPPEPQSPAGQGQQQGQPPQGQQGQAQGQGQQQGDPPPPGPAAESALAEERKARKAAEQRVAELEAQHLTEQEKAVKAAREEGRTEALAAAGRQLAAAEFRYLAAGKIADPDAAVELIDLAKLVDDDGKPNRQAITALVDHLAALPQGQPGEPGRVPAGPRGTAPSSSGDWIRDISRRH
jgi:hypothetical protein